MTDPSRTRLISLRAALRRVCITDGRAHREKPHCDSILAAAQRGGASAILVREKDLDDAGLAALTSELVERATVPVLLAHRPDLALRVGASGVHLGFSSPDPRTVREATGFVGWIGRSVHTLEEAMAYAESVDYLMFGPIRSTPSKEGMLTPQGFDALARVARAVNVPVVAVGGLSLAEEQDVADAGALGWAAIRAFDSNPSLEVNSA